MSANLGIGLIGSGAMARAYVACLARASGARLVAIGGGSRAPQLAASAGVPALTAAEVIGHPDVGAVIIATPETAHAEYAVAAAQRGRHVLVEKPLAPSLAACDAIIDAARLAGVTLMVVKHWRFRGTSRRLREQLRSGACGAIRRIENSTLVARASSLATLEAKPFYLTPGGGGLLMGWAVHNLDWVRCLAGAEVTEVSGAVTAGVAPVREGELNARLAFANGVEARVRVAIDLPAEMGRAELFRTVVETERARFEVDGLGELRVHDDVGSRVLWTQPAFDPRASTDPVRLEAFRDLLQAFVDSVVGGRPPPVSGEDGRAAVALFERLRG